MLRDWKPDDAGRLLEIRSEAEEAGDSDLLHNNPGPGLPQMEQWLEYVLEVQQHGTGRAWAILDGKAEPGTASPAASRPTSPVVGNVMVGNIDRANSLGWVSYWLASDARGRGLAAAALRLAVQLAHDELGVYRLELGYRLNNPASARVAAAAGFVVEGRQREKLRYDGRRFDTEECAHLAGDPIPGPAPRRPGPA